MTARLTTSWMRWLLGFLGLILVTIPTPAIAACTNRIGDLVWLDVNRNGRQDPGEPGIAGVRMVLENSFGRVLARVTTDDNGLYRFDGLCAGTYVVRYVRRTVPEGLVPTEAHAEGTTTADDSNGSSARVVLSSSAGSRLSIDFGFMRTVIPTFLDPTFGTGGRVTTDVTGGLSFERINALAVQPDDAIVVAGTTGCCFLGFPRFAVGRYTRDGVLDASFAGGIVSLTIGINDRASAVLVQPDGKVVAAGDTRGTGLDADLVLARFNANGTPDTDFGRRGLVVRDFHQDGDEDSATGIARQPDGKLVVVGVIRGRFGVARFNADGTLDSSFGPGGTTRSADPADAAFAVALAADGKIVVAGRIGSAFGLRRYNTDGSLDTTFGAGGSVVTDLGAKIAAAVAIQSDGKIVAAGGPGAFVVVRYLPDGTPDPAFGTGGIVTTSLSPLGAGATALAIQSDGKIVAAGWTEVADSPALIPGTTPFDPARLADFALVRYETDGRLDASFGLDGKIATDFSSETEVASDAAFGVGLQSDGKVVAAGVTAVTCGGSGACSQFALSRYALPEP